MKKTTLSYRLLGEVEGVEKAFDLVPGEHRIGSAHTSDLELPVAGVSRQHAVLRVMPRGLVIEDRGSRNGTFVDDLRVDRAAVPVGAELRFGPVRLRAESVDAEDVELGIVVGTPPPTTAPGSSRNLLEESTQVMGKEETRIPASWLSLVEGFSERIAGRGESSLGAALGFLVAELELSAAGVLEWLRGDDPVVRASVGPIGGLPSRDQVRTLAGARSTGEPGTAFFDTAPPASVAVSGGTAAPRALLLWGDFTDRLTSSKLLSVLLRLVNRLDLAGPAPESARQASAETVFPKEIVFPEDHCVLRSPPMEALYHQLCQLSRSDLPVLIVGETGVGKEKLARTLHASSQRRNGPYVAVNCAAIPAELLETEMFGIGKGVATGVERRQGKFQLADGGTLFLDEIGEMAPELQAKLLRALQEKEAYPVGGRPCPVDVWVVAATNAELGERMEAGLFRRDLYYRIAGDVVEVPPLRECRGDIPLLVEHFLKLFARGTGIRVRGVTVKALRLLSAYGWPGNVRQLEHEVRRMVVRSRDGQAIDSTALSAEVLRGGGEPRPPIPLDPIRLEPRIRELEEHLIREALRRTDGNLTRAAELLGMTRYGLSKKLKRLAMVELGDGGGPE